MEKELWLAFSTLFYSNKYHKLGLLCSNRAQVPKKIKIFQFSHEISRKISPVSD